MPNFYIFFLTASVADAAAINPNGVKTLLANGVATFFINDKPNLVNEARTLPRNLTF